MKERVDMSPLIGIVVLPLGIIAAGIGNGGDAMWLVFAAVLAIATSYVARRNSGS